MCLWRTPGVVTPLSVAVARLCQNSVASSDAQVHVLRFSVPDALTLQPLPLQGLLSSLGYLHGLLRSWLPRLGDRRGFRELREFFCAMVLTHGITFHIRASPVSVAER